MSDKIKDNIMFVDASDIYINEPTYSGITFCFNNKNVGRLSEKNGKLHFEGELTESGKSLITFIESYYETENVGLKKRLREAIHKKHEYWERINKLTQANDELKFWLLISVSVIITVIATKIYQGYIQ